MNVSPNSIVGMEAGCIAIHHIYICAYEEIKKVYQEDPSEYAKIVLAFKYPKRKDCRNKELCDSFIKRVSEQDDKIIEDIKSHLARYPESFNNLFNNDEEIIDFIHSNFVGYWFAVYASVTAEYNIKCIIGKNINRNTTRKVLTAMVVGNGY